MLLASSIGEIAHPFFIVFAWLIERFYSLIPNYAIAIGLLTIVVMIIVFPITRQATRSMMKMQLLAPELKKIQTRYKVPPGTPVAERQEARQHLNDEMMALYRENNVSPTGGCLPMLLQLPIFWILYGTIRGLIHLKTFPTAAAARAWCKHPVSAKACVQPLYINHASSLYHAVIHANGKLMAFGINMANSVRSAGLSWGAKMPLIALILIAIALQYIQIRQVSGRNAAAAAANPQMQQMQRIMPIVFALIYIAIPAGVNVYFIVSSLFRIGQQEYMYRRDPHIRESLAKLNARAKAAPTVVASEGRERSQMGFFERLVTPAALQSGADTKTAPGPVRSTGDGEAPANVRPPAVPRTVPQGGRGPGGSPRRSQPRARGKRPRKPR
ncbi:MAG: YidC/Oxa1 family membrane protein insertase [Acidimicrobiales bacterium]|jgi:YidC/Oxa1 family membrane protein insertase